MAKQKKPTGFDTSHAKEEFKTSPLAPLSLKNNPLNFEGRDPGRAYKLIDFQKFKESGFRDYRGWIPLTKENKTTEKIQTPDELYGVKTDGFFHERDRIIAWMPRERYDQMRALIAEKTRAKTRSAKDSSAAKKLARQSGLQVYEEK